MRPIKPTRKRPTGKIDLETYVLDELAPRVADLVKFANLILGAEEYAAPAVIDGELQALRLGTAGDDLPDMDTTIVIADGQVRTSRTATSSRVYTLDTAGATYGMGWRFIKLQTDYSVTLVGLGNVVLSAGERWLASFVFDGAGWAATGAFRTLTSGD